MAEPHEAMVDETLSFAFGDETPLTPHNDWTPTVTEPAQMPAILNNVDVEGRWAVVGRRPNGP